MIFYGIELAPGTEAINLVVEHGIENPTMELGQDPGRLFFNTASATLNIWNGTSWSSIALADGTTVSSFNGRTGIVTLLPSDLIGLLDATNLPIASATTLGAIKIGSGLSISIDGTLSAGGGGGDMPSGTKLLFPQAAAPIGWTQITTTQANNRMLRVVSTTGGGYGGSDDPTIMTKVSHHTHTLTTDASGTHSHSFTWTNAGSFVGPPVGVSANTSGQDGNLDGSDRVTGHDRSTIGMGIANAGSHTHTGHTAGNSGAANWTPKYLNLILCTKN